MKLKNPSIRPACRKDRFRRRVRFLAQAAITAALYVALTGISAVFGLSSMPIQLRLSESLCILTLFTPAAVPGLFVGCLLANLLTGSPVWDVLFGSLATLIGAVGGWLLSRLVARIRRRTGGRSRMATFLTGLVPLPTVLANAVIVPFVLIHAYGLEGTYPLFFATVGAGELASAWGFGLLLLPLLRRIPFLKSASLPR